MAGTPSFAGGGICRGRYNVLEQNVLVRFVYYDIAKPCIHRCGQLRPVYSLETPLYILYYLIISPCPRVRKLTEIISTLHL